MNDEHEWWTNKSPGPFDSFWLINDAQTNEAKVWPRLQYAFESRVFGMSCILYRLTQLAAFFLDQRAEWSTTNSCYCLLNLSWRHQSWCPNCKLGKSFWFWLKLGLDNEKASFRKPFIILNALKAHTTHKWCAHFSHVKLPCIRGFGFGWQIFKPSSSLVLS